MRSLDISFQENKKNPEEFHGIDYSREKPSAEDALKNILGSTLHTEKVAIVEGEKKVFEHEAKLRDGAEVRNCGLFFEHLEGRDLAMCQAYFNNAAGLSNM